MALAAGMLQASGRDNLAAEFLRDPDFGVPEKRRYARPIFAAGNNELYVEAKRNPIPLFRRASGKKLVSRSISGTKTTGLSSVLKGGYFFAGTVSVLVAPRAEAPTDRPSGGRIGVQSSHAAKNPPLATPSEFHYLAT